MTFISNRRRELSRGIRGVKDASELALVARAVRLADEAMASASSVLEPGITEAQIAWHIEQELRRLGAEGPAFDIIVAAGPNGALPHHRADDTVVRARQRGCNRYGRPVRALPQRPDQNVPRWRSPTINSPRSMELFLEAQRGRDRRGETRNDGRRDRLDRPQI